MRYVVVCVHVLYCDGGEKKSLLSTGPEAVWLQHIFNDLSMFNPLNPELNPICCLLALLVANHFLHVSRIKVKSLTLGLLMSYLMEHPFLMFLDHTQRRSTVGRTPLGE